MPEIGGFVADRWPDRDGPLQGPFAVFCELLPVIWFLSNKPEGIVVERYAERHPALLDLAKALLHADILSKYQGRPVIVPLRELWSQLSIIDQPN